MKAPPAAAPLERLSNGGLGPVLERANREFEANIDESAAFRRLAERLEQKPSRARSGLKLALALGFACAMFPLFQRALSSSPGPAITAEPARAASAPQIAPKLEARGESSAEQAEQGVREATPVARRQHEVAGLAPARAPQPNAPQPHSAGPSPAAPSSAAPAAAASDAPKIEGPDCLSLARAGSTRGAEACFLERAAGSGLGAEMALYEVARLRRDVLADPNGALEALADYRRRFPAGSLRREADMSQLELLMQLGRSEDALRQTQELLSSSAAGERAGELYLLRGHIFRKNLHDLRAAEREYALAEQAQGASRLEATYFRGTCLQALGENAAAAAAYSSYLEKGGRTYAAEAKKRLEAFAP